MPESFSIKYEVHPKGKKRKTGRIDQSKETGAIARARVQHIAAISFLLAHIDLSEPIEATKQSAEELNNQMRTVGDLMQKMADGLFWDVDRLDELARTLTAKEVFDCTQESEETDDSNKDSTPF
jgi:hypothetical protein